jgi:hypothetical protein
MEAIPCSESSVLTRAKRRHIPEDVILHNLLMFSVITALVTILSCLIITDLTCSTVASFVTILFERCITHLIYTFLCLQVSLQNADPQKRPGL